MDKMNIDEIDKRLKNKPTLASGSIYEMFGSRYLTVANTKGVDPCDMCAFNKCACMINVDIPSCDNDVHFELIKGIKFALCDSFGEILDMVEYIDNNTVKTKDGSTYDMLTLFRKDYTIEPMIVR